MFTGRGHPYLASDKLSLIPFEIRVVVFVSTCVCVCMCVCMCSLCVCMCVCTLCVCVCSLCVCSLCVCVVCVRVCMVCIHMCMLWCVWRSENSFQVSVLSVSCGFWGLDAGCQACPVGAFTSEPPGWPAVGLVYRRLTCAENLQ